MRSCASFTTFSRASTTSIVGSSPKSRSLAVEQMSAAMGTWIRHFPFLLQNDLGSPVACSCAFSPAYTASL